MKTPGTKDEAVNIDEVMALAARLSSVDKVQLIERLLTHIKLELKGTKPAARQSLSGALSDLGSAPSAEEIDEARREAWANFPHQDV